MQTLDSSEDTDLELMFAEIRRYPLLTADEEKDIDSKKWDAVFELSSVNMIYFSFLKLKPKCP